MTLRDRKITCIGTIEQGASGAELRVAEAYRAGLKGLGAFSHAVILWWAHETEAAAQQTLVLPRPYTGSSGNVGVFATRSEARINPIGLSVIEIAGVDETAGILHTYWIDTLPGTPLVDIKPYFPASDRVETAHMPDWAAGWPQSLEASADFDWEAAFK